MQPTIYPSAEPMLYHSCFADFIDSFIAKLESGEILTDKGKIYSENTIRVYTLFAVNFRLYEKTNFLTLLTSEISYDVAEDFQMFLVNNTKNSKNTIAVILAKLKAILAYAFRKGFAYWGGEKFKISREVSTQTYLSSNEIITLKNGELTEGEKKVLDIQIIQAFTGMRNATLKKFLGSPMSYIHEYDGKTYIDITEDKTDKQSIVPLGDIVINILKKYNGSIRVPSQQYINKKIKIIAMKSGLTNEIVIRKTINGVTQEFLTPKFKKISTHTSRRTLISLMSEAGFQASEIMPISGHATEGQMNKYVKLGNVQKIKHLFGNDFFNTTLNEQD